MTELARIARPRPWLLRRLPVLVVAAGVAAGGAFVLLREPAGKDCRSIALTAPAGDVVRVCQREYERTDDPEVGAILVDAIRRSDNAVVAKALANDLLATSARADAMYTLGKIAASEGRHEEAITLFEEARAQHRQARRHRASARSAHALAGIHHDEHRYAEALKLLDDCLGEATAARDRSIEFYCRISIARALISVGFFDAAEQQLGRAGPLASGDAERGGLARYYGDLWQERHRGAAPIKTHKLAIPYFQRALEFAERSRNPQLKRSSHLNLAYSHAELRELERAQHHLDHAKLLDSQHKHTLERQQVAARIAFRRNDLALASSLNDEAYATAKDIAEQLDERIEICSMQARIKIAAGDLPRAQQWAELGIQHVERLRAQQSAPELRGWALSSQREPYELLFTIRVRTGQLEAALATFDLWHRRSLLETMAHDVMRSAGDGAAVEPREVAGALEQLTKLSAGASASLLRSDETSPLKKELRGIDLLALLVADEQLWRIAAVDGDLQITDLGRYEAHQAQLEAFGDDPTDPGLAEQLGILLVPGHMQRTTRDALRVVLDGPLSYLPIAALRRGGVPLIKARPIVHAPRISELACQESGSRSGRAVVIADPRGDLPHAQGEARQIARTLHAEEVFLGKNATSGVLFGAVGSDVLHVASHARRGAGQGVLVLYDKKVSALEIIAHPPWPRLVVLAACSTAVAPDRELAGALPTAFLSAGSQQVVATFRDINDRKTRDVMTSFYAEGGVHDPVRALARVQASLVDTSNKEWPSFAVFGRDVCATP